MRNNQRDLYSQNSEFDSQFRQLNECMDSIKAGMDGARQKLGEHDFEIRTLKEDKASKTELKSLKQTVATLKANCDSKFDKLDKSERDNTALQMTIEKQERELRNLKLEIKSLEHNHSETRERASVLEINNKHLSLTIDNIPEEKDVQPSEAVIKRLNEDTEEKLGNDLVKAAHRVGKLK